MSAHYTTFILTAVPPNLRHALTRWMIEPAAGVFVGTISVRVRDELWAQIRAAVADGCGLSVSSGPTEQGFTIRSCGTQRRELIDLDGLQLVAHPRPLTTKTTDTIG